MAFFKKPKYSHVTFKKKDIPKNLFTKCPISGEIIYHKELKNNLMVVPKSGYHFSINASDRICSLLDEGSFAEEDAGLASVDPLKFKDLYRYRDKLKQDQEKTGMAEAVMSGLGSMANVPVSIAVMDFRFRGASMGSVVGEKITRAIERAADRKIPLIIVAASGGARMQEGILSLMQMAKTSAALVHLRAVKVPYISILTNPTMAGVSASFATLGDVILAEPGALIGFTGGRVIRETLQVELPKGFQTSEFLLRHGLIDQIVPRSELRDRVVTLLYTLYVGKEPPQRKTA